MRRSYSFPFFSPAKPGPARVVGSAISVLVGLFTVSWVLPVPDLQSILEEFDLTAGAGTEVKLPRILEEVSGLATTPDGRLFAHNDESAILFQVDVARGEILKRFSVGMMGIPGDFEGLAVVGERFFLMTSRGQLLEFREGRDGSTVGYRVHSLGLQSSCEFEGLAFDQSTEVLLMPCKTPRLEAWKDHLVVLSIPVETMKPNLEPHIFIPIAELDRRGLGDDFHPSSIEVHPESGSRLLIAAREEALLELSPQGEVASVAKLKKKDHPQPEGLAFLSDGSLVVADEGQGKMGTLTLYARTGGKEGGVP